jgi:hypothetical protein
MTPLNPRGKIRWTNIYTKGEIRHTHIFSIRLNNMTSLKRGGRSNGHIYTKGEDQTDKYIYYKIEQHDSTKTKGGRPDGQIYILRGEIRRTHIYSIRLKRMTPLKQRWKIRRTNIYTLRLKNITSVKQRGR